MKSKVSHAPKGPGKGRRCGICKVPKMPKKKILFENLASGVRFFRILTKSAKNTIFAFSRFLRPQNTRIWRPKKRVLRRPRATHFLPTPLFCRGLPYGRIFFAIVWNPKIRFFGTRRTSLVTRQQGLIGERKRKAF